MFTFLNMPKYKRLKFTYKANITVPEFIKTKTMMYESAVTPKNKLYLPMQLKCILETYLELLGVVHYCL